MLRVTGQLRRSLNLIACHATVSGKSTVLCLQCAQLVYFQLRIAPTCKRLVGQGLGWLVVPRPHEMDAYSHVIHCHLQSLPPTMNVDFGNDARNPHFDGGRVGTRLHEIDKTLLYGARRALQ